MAVNKVETSDGTILIDLTQDTFTSSDQILRGYTAHLSSGEQVTGTWSLTVDDTLSDDSENPVENQVIKAALDTKANTADLPSTYVTSFNTETGDVTMPDASTSAKGLMTTEQVTQLDTVCDDLGDVSTLLTEDKTSAVNAINELHTDFDEKFLDIPVSSENTTTVTWNDFYTAYSNGAVITAKIEYNSGTMTTPISVPLYSLIGGEEGGMLIFTFIMGLVVVNYFIGGSGDNVCSVTQQANEVEVISNKVSSVVSNSASTTYYPTTKAVYDELQRKPVTIWEVEDVTQGLLALNADMSASPAWQLTDLDFSPYKRIKVFTAAGDSGSSTTPSVVLEMLLDSRAASTAYGNHYIGSFVGQKSNNSNRLYTLVCAVSSDKTSFAVMRMTSLYGTAATSNTGSGGYVFRIEGYYD